MTVREAKGKVFEFGKDTRLHITISAIVCVMVIVYQATMIYASLMHELEAIKHQNSTILGTRWSYEMERESWWEFGKENPSIKIPDVDEIKRHHTPRRNDD